MNAKHLVATLALTLAAGVTFAALKQAPVETPRAALPTPALAAECADAMTPGIPRVVVTAKREQEAQVARIVVTAKRAADPMPIAAVMQ